MSPGPDKRQTACTVSHAKQKVSFRDLKGASQVAIAKRQRYWI